MVLLGGGTDRAQEIVGPDLRSRRDALRASVPRGQGNDGRSGAEGAIQGTVVGTYLHGPVLAVNPDFTDTLLARALAPVTDGEPLPPIDDALERTAQAEAARRPREE